MAGGNKRPNVLKEPCSLVCLSTDEFLLQPDINGLRENQDCHLYIHS